MRVKALAISIILLIGFAGVASGQGPYSSYSQDKVNIYGLTKTKEGFLRRIMSEQALSLGYSTLESDVQALRNLPSVAEAKYTIDTLDQNPVYNILIVERTTALPIINFGGIRGNIWFQVGLTENNFRGVGETLLGFYQNNNGRHAGQLYFQKPRILSSDWGYSLNLNSWSSQEPIFFDEGTEQYEYTNNAVGASILRNFGLFNRLELGGTYFVESYERSEGQGESPLGPSAFSLPKFLAKIEYKNVELDHQYFYLKGMENIITYQNVITIDERSFFNSIQYQGRLFLRPRPKLNLAFRVRMALSDNDNSPFAPFVADSHVNVRGIGNRIDRGTAQLIINAEARYTIYHEDFWASQLVIFSDSGTWRNPGGQLSQLFDPDQFRQFVGVGVRINYQKVFGATLRIDYGVDIYDLSQRGFVIGLGQYF